MGVLKRKHPLIRVLYEAPGRILACDKVKEP